MTAPASKPVRFFLASITKPGIAPKLFTVLSMLFNLKQMLLYSVFKFKEIRNSRQLTSTVRILNDICFKENSVLLNLVKIKERIKGRHTISMYNMFSCITETVVSIKTPLVIFLYKLKVLRDMVILKTFFTIKEAQQQMHNIRLTICNRMFDNNLGISL